MNHYPEFNQDSVAEMLAWLPMFSADKLAHALDYYLVAGQDLEQVIKFSSAVYSSGFVVQFDCPEWEKQFANRPLDEVFIKQADLETVRKILTMYVRQDRFSGGTMAKMCSSGLIQIVLERLKHLSTKSSG